jgi:hypothetical protein
MKTRSISWVFLIMLAMLTACGQTGGEEEIAPEQLAETMVAQTAAALSFTPKPTDTPQFTPTNTEVPATETPTPTQTPLPTWEPVEISEIEAALRLAGYRRYPFVTNEGVNGFTWINLSSYEQVKTMEDGSIELQILQDGSAFERDERMERHFEVLDGVLPAGVMEQLRPEHVTYNDSVPSSVSGEPDEIYAYRDEFKTVWAEYDATEVDLRGYEVRFSLWWWQSTCPASAWFCYYSNFPGLEFTGDSSFIFYTILIRIPDTS